MMLPGDDLWPRFRDWWPWVSRRRFETAQRENYTLRDALREANADLRRHRTLLGGLRDGDRRMTDAVQRAITNG